MRGGSRRNIYGRLPDEVMMLFAFLFFWIFLCQSFKLHTNNKHTQQPRKTKTKTKPNTPRYNSKQRGGYTQWFPFFSFRFSFVIFPDVQIFKSVCHMFFLCPRMYIIPDDELRLRLFRFSHLPDSLFSFPFCHIFP